MEAATDAVLGRPGGKLRLATTALCQVRLHGDRAGCAGCGVWAWKFVAVCGGFGPRGHVPVHWGYQMGFGPMWIIISKLFLLCE